MLVTFLLPIPLYAIGNPENGVSIGDIYVFRDVFKTGDQLYFVRYDVSYDPVPEESAENTWQMALYDSSGLLVKSRPLSYYQHNVTSVYLEPDEALGWEGAQVVRIMGAPPLFNLVEGVNMRTRILGPELYHEGTDLGPIMVAQAEILDADWEVALLTLRKRLTATGGLIFEKAVPGLSIAVPEIFELVEVQPTVDYKEYGGTYAETLRGNAGQKLTNAIVDIGSAIGLSKDWVIFWGAMIFYLMVGGLVFAGRGNPSWAFIAAFPVVVGGAYLLGGSLFILAIVITATAAIIFGLYFILGRFA